MKFRYRRSFAALLLCSTACAAQAGGTVEASARALDHSMQALGYSIEAGLKLSFGAAAIPLTAAGAVGEASGRAGTDMMEFANAPPRGPLPISDEIVTAGPKPDEQLKSQEPDKPQ